ncbi:MAG: DUF86 domain-containing protein, partial [Chloroflexota bacterium]|nr:DUF86 domain-containing protein [Chloroflexota bacterium]
AEEDAIVSRLQLLRDYKAQLLEIPTPNFQEYNRNILAHKATERLLQTAIEACLDIGKHIIAQERFRFPGDNQDVFVVLSEENVIPKSLLARLQDMARFRNLLVHEYAKIDNETVYGILKKRLGDFDEYASAIVDYLKRPPANDRTRKLARERRATYAVRKRKTAR